MAAEYLQINKDVSIPLDEIDVSAIRAQGAGGQNVNKVASAIHLRFDAANCDSIPMPAKERLLALPDRRITADGIIVIKAQSFRTQEKNLKDAMQRLATLVATALVVEKPRKKTKISKARKKKRIDNKRKRGQTKLNRRRVDDD